MKAVIPGPHALAELEHQLLELLSAAPNGLSEYALLKQLRTCNKGFAEFDARQPLSLFRGHFLLFHALYRLRDRVRQERRGWLAIEPLAIVLHPSPAETLPMQASLAPPEADHLREWYGDWNRWETATAADVLEWLRQFRVLRQAGGQRARALAALGLQDPVDQTAIRQQYRRLAMQHHPDRGGDGLRLREINAAWAVLATRSRD
ncbi:MAG: DnaJ domain-containing protein [Candidatus Competibacteraceae bacterium]|nr:DnaJ domain-containing protein [Candidatus Competibacteraceae bacterium]